MGSRTQNAMCTGGSIAANRRPAYVGERQEAQRQKIKKASDQDTTGGHFTILQIIGVIAQEREDETSKRQKNASTREEGESGRPSITQLERTGGGRISTSRLLLHVALTPRNSAPNKRIVN